MRDINALHPALQDKLYQLVELCEKKGIIIAIGECLRTVAEQDALYAQGRTTPGSVVTNAKGSTYSSMHQWGVAFDFYLKMDVDGDGKTSDDSFNNSTGLFEAVGQIGKSIGLEWGGDWKSIKDRPHFQLPDWGSTASKLKSTYGTPEKFMKTWKKSGGNSNTQNKTPATGSSTTGIGIVNAASGLKVRKGPSTSQSVVCTMPTKVSCDIIELGVAQANGYTWAKVSYKGTTGYVAEKYLTISKYPASSKTMSTAMNVQANYSKNIVEGAALMKKSLAGTYKTTSNLNLRTGAGTTKDIILTIPKGNKVTNYGYYTSVGGEKWLLVAYNKYTGYVHEKYLTK